MANLKDIQVDLLSYDSVSITHMLGLHLVSKEVVAIGIGRRDTSGYVESIYRPATYDFEFYFHDFDFLVKLGFTEFLPHLVIRYYFVNSATSDIDTIVPAYKYPYPETEVLGTKSIFIDHAQYFQDVDRMGTKIFFHPYAAFGLYEYDLVTHTTTRLLNYGSGQVIAADSIFVFCHVGDRIQRYNLLTHTVDLVLPPYVGDITGLDIYNQHLYVYRFNHYRLFRFTYDGVPVDTLYLPGQDRYYIAVYNGILYFQNWGPQIERFDLTTMTYLPKVIAPYPSSDGIKIYEDHLYFCDARGFIGSVPLASLRSL